MLSLQSRVTVIIIKQARWLWFSRQHPITFTDDIQDFNYTSWHHDPSVHQATRGQTWWPPPFVFLYVGVGANLESLDMHRGLWKMTD